METIYIPPSLKYRKQAFKAILSIVLFILGYSLLLLVSAVLAAGCAYAGVLLALDFDHFSIIKVLLGLAIMFIGFSLLYFMVRFLFMLEKEDTSMYIEITRESQPQLFKLLEEIVEKVGTQFPKAVYVSHDVNASVFSSVNFWSLFYSSKKNLVIGMGLINSSSYSELKAVLAHEFGHFSQKSMKIGGFVNRLNTVVSKMLTAESYQLDGYEDLEDRSPIAKFTRWTSESMIETIRTQLRSLYLMLNKSQMALTREMEFHADAVAVAVTGRDPLKESLLRMSLSTASLEQVLGFYTQRINDSVVSNNIYPLQQFVMMTLAKESDLKIRKGLPLVGIHDLMKFNKSKLEIEDKWSSHPKLVDRISSINQQPDALPSVNSSMALDIFRNSEQLQTELTAMLFDRIQYPNETVLQSKEEFEEAYLNLLNQFSYHSVFNSYYNDKKAPDFNLNSLEPTEVAEDVQELFSDVKVDWIYTEIALESDLAYLKEIHAKRIPVKRFSYDGVLYKYKDIKGLYAKLKVELKELAEHVNANDLKVYQYFTSLEESLDKEMKLQSLYANWIGFDEVYKENQDMYDNLQSELQFINEVHPVEVITTKLQAFAQREADLKLAILKLLDDHFFSEVIDKETRRILEEYSHNQLEYFGLRAYHQNNLDLLFGAMNSFIIAISKGYLLHKYHLVKYQECLLIASGIINNTVVGEPIVVKQKTPDISI